MASTGKWHVAHSCLPSILGGGMMTPGDQSMSVSQLSSPEAWEPPRAMELARSLSPSVPVPLRPCPPPSLGPCPPPRPLSSSQADRRTPVKGKWSWLSSLHGRVSQIHGPTRRKAWLTEPPRYPPPKHPRLLRKLGSPFSILPGGTPSPLGLLGGPERGSEQGCTVCSQGHCPVAPEMISRPRRDPLLGPCPCASLTGAPSTPPQVLAEEHGRESVSFLGTKAPWPGSWLPHAPARSPYGNPSGWDHCPMAQPGGRADISG